MYTSSADYANVSAPECLSRAEWFEAAEVQAEEDRSEYCGGR